MSFGSVLKKVGHVTGKVAKYAAPVLAMTGVGAPLAALVGAGGGLLENATGGSASLKGALTSGATGAALGLAPAAFKGAAGALGGLGGGGGGAIEAAGAKRGILSKVGGVAGDLMKGIGGGSLSGGIKALGGLALGGLAVKDSRDQRNAQAAFESGKFDILKTALGKAESEYDSRAGLRTGGADALKQAMAALSGMGSGPAAEHFADLKSGKRKPGEYV